MIGPMQSEADDRPKVHRHDAGNHDPPERGREPKRCAEREPIRVSHICAVGTRAGSRSDASSSSTSISSAHDPSHLSHSAGSASEGMRQSPRGERLTVPTLGPSGTHDRLYCWRKNRRWPRDADCGPLSLDPFSSRTPAGRRTDTRRAGDTSGFSP